MNGNLLPMVQGASPRLLLGFLLILVLSGCDSKNHSQTSTPKKLPEVTVSVSEVFYHPAPNQVEVVGTVQAVDQAEISAKITGNIILLPVETGSRVEKGELLVEISAEEISARLEQARAQLEQARRNLAREEKLLKKNAATSESVKRYRDTLVIAQAGFKEAETMLGYTRITAPFTGIITAKRGNKGDLATPGKVLLKLERDNKLQIVTYIPEAMVGAIDKGDQLTASIPAVDARVKGVVTEMSPVSDPSSRTTPIKLRIKGGTGIRSGQFARVYLELAKSKTLVVPATAIVPFGQMERVFVESKNQASLRLVQTGSVITGDSNIRLIEVLSGLEAGEKVVTSNNFQLQHGQPLAIQ